MTKIQTRTLYEIADVAAMLLQDLEQSLSCARERCERGEITELELLAQEQRLRSLRGLLAAAGYTQRDKYTNFLHRDASRCPDTLDMLEGMPA